jgi:hypothetical protein
MTREETMMASNTRTVRIDLSNDVPTRARPLDAEDLTQVFAGCLGEFQACDWNWSCCSNKCRKAWFINGQWTWECLPTWAPKP